MLESWEIKFRPEAESIRRMAKEFAEKQVAPIADRIDRENKYPTDLLEEMAKQGYSSGETEDTLEYLIARKVLVRTERGVKMS